MVIDRKIVEQLEWHGFLTWTFRDPCPSPVYQWVKIQRHARWMAKMRGVFYPDLLWLPRFEPGERTQRDHAHGLIAFRSGQPHKSFFEAAANVWNDMSGFAKFRVFDPSLDGVDYVLDGIGDVEEYSRRKANQYETAKYCRAETVIPESIYRVLLAAQRRSGYYDVRTGRPKRSVDAAILVATDKSAVMRGQQAGAVERAKKSGGRGYIVDQGACRLG